MRIGFYCATPFHILSAIWLMLTRYKNWQGDLFILNHFADAVGLADRIEKTTLFNRVHLINQTNRNLMEKLKRLGRVFIPDQVIHSINKEYDYNQFVFFAYDFLNATLIVKKVFKRNKACIFCFGDDGVGSYCDPLYTPAPKAKLLLTLTGRRKYVNLIDTLLVYCPDLVVENKHLRIEPLQCCDFKNQDFLCIIREVWPGTLDAFADKHILYFGQIFPEMNFKDCTDVEQELFNDIREMGLADYLLIKPHPRILHNPTFDGFPILDDRRPFEAILPLINIENKILVSTFSTALFTPYIFAGKCPGIIVVNKLFDLDTPKYEEFIQEYMKMSADKQRIFIPHTGEEFRKALEKCWGYRHD